MRLQGKIVLVVTGQTVSNSWTDTSPRAVLRYVTGISNISATTLGTPFTSISAPRFWGVEVAAHF